MSTSETSCPMAVSSVLSMSNEYQSFRSSVPLRKVIVDPQSNQGWTIYDSGPKTVRCPLICLPPVSGTADIYFKQVLSLNAKGYRVISVEHPAYWSIPDWCNGFLKLLDHLELDQVHIFGASLGGFLAQKFAEFTANYPRVCSLVLCNTFYDTSVFNRTVLKKSSSLLWVFPSLILKRMIMGNFAPSNPDSSMVDSIDFMVERLDSLSQSDLASRLTLNCSNSFVDPQKLKHLEAVTIIDVYDEYALSGGARETMYKCYPNAKPANLKSGGNFPYLSRPDEVNLHLEIHLRGFNGTPHSAQG